MKGISLLPAMFVDMAGSFAIIVFAFLAARDGFQLARRAPENFIWGYLFYICLAIAAFSISRAIGHIIKHVLLMTEQGPIWTRLAPFSGGFNTLFMISVAAVTLYYHKGFQAYEAIEKKTKKLRKAYEALNRNSEELKSLNLHLEEKVEERTAELAKSEKKFRHLFTASKDMVFFCDNQHKVVDMNDSGFAMLGYDPAHPPALELKQIFSNPGDLGGYAAMVKRDGFIKDMEIDFRKKDGAVINALLSATAVFDERGNMVGCESIAKNLTRVKTMMEQLVSSEKMASVGQMAAGVAHEINTPLGVILGYAQLLKDDFEKDSETYQGLEVIERQTQASRKIVADLLKFSRQTGSNRENLNLNEVLNDVLAVTEHNLHLGGITVFRHLEEALPEVVGDAEKLRQVFVNLINNAHHAMEDNGGGELHIRTIADTALGTVTVEIEDNGHGIPDEIKSRIFDPFFTTKPVGKGTGLGLSVSYGIVLDHEGTIVVESPVRSRAKTDAHPGTIFRIVLPVAETLEVQVTADETHL